MSNSKYIWNFDRVHLLKKMREFEEKIGDRVELKDFESDGTFEQIVLEVYPDINAYIRDYEKLSKNKRIANQEGIRTVLDRLRKLSGRFEALNKGDILDVAYAINTGYFYDGTNFASSSFLDTDKVYDMVEFYKRIPDLAALYLLPANAPQFFKSAVETIKNFIRALKIQPMGRIFARNSFPANSFDLLTQSEIDMILDYMEKSNLPFSARIFGELSSEYLKLKRSCSSKSDVVLIKKILFDVQASSSQKIANFISWNVSLSFFERVSILKKIIGGQSSLTNEFFSEEAEKVASLKFSNFIKGENCKLERPFEYTGDYFKSLYGSKIKLQNFEARILTLKSLLVILLGERKSRFDILYEVYKRYGSISEFNDELNWILNLSIFRNDYNLADWDNLIDVARLAVSMSESLLTGDVGVKKYFDARVREDLFEKTKLKLSKFPSYNFLEKYIVAYEEANGNFNDREFLRKSRVPIQKFSQYVEAVREGCRAENNDYAMFLYGRYQKILRDVYDKKFKQISNRLVVICGILRAREALGRLDDDTNSSSFDCFDNSVDSCNVFPISYILALMPFNEPYYSDEFSSYYELTGKKVEFTSRVGRNGIEYSNSRVGLGPPKNVALYSDTLRGRVLAFAKTYLSLGDYNVLKDFFVSLDLCISDEECQSPDTSRKIYNRFCSESNTVVYGKCSRKVFFGIEYPETSMKVSLTEFNAIKDFMECLGLPYIPEVFSIVLCEYRNGYNLGSGYNHDVIIKFLKK